MVPVILLVDTGCAVVLVLLVEPGARTKVNSVGAETAAESGADGPEVEAGPASHVARLQYRVKRVLGRGRIHGLLYKKKINEISYTLIIFNIEYIDINLYLSILNVWKIVSKIWGRLLPFFLEAPYLYISTVLSVQWHLSISTCTGAASCSTTASSLAATAVNTNNHSKLLEQITIHSSALK